ncbi:hypothetical protein HGM15179_015204 [Zosterops borbonicus]|uniref:Uncharacterized protein n=1 Tax=Zosterops borbonicus TaxID=364589 RepID=A0A8K1LFB4_9PASS|nr:hypothetical protein HGM15179_015204 [Zosterops borbonicus]
MVREDVTLHPMKINRIAEIHPQPMEETHISGELEMTPLSGICLGLGYLTIVHQQMDRADELSVVGGKTSCHNDKENMFSSRSSGRLHRTPSPDRAQMQNSSGKYSTKAKFKVPRLASVIFIGIFRVDAISQGWWLKERPFLPMTLAIKPHILEYLKFAEYLVPDDLRETGDLSEGYSFDDDLI